MKKSLHFLVPDSIDPAHLIDTIQHEYKTTQAPAATYQRCFYDTFDWRLFHCGLYLYWQDGTLHLIEMNASRTVVSIPWSAKKPPTQIKHLPAGPLHEKLAEIVEMRALLLLADTFVKKQQINILNRDQKSIARLYLEKFYRNRQTADPLFSVFQIETIRGYRTGAKKCKKFALSLEMVPSDNSAILNTLFHSFGHKPCSYSTKLDFTLVPEQTACTAAFTIFQSQLAIMKQNEHGIQADIDTEFLHDFRVALRRTRAGLSELKGIFSKDVTKRFKTDLKKIGAMTNRLRDLDVYLLKKDYYKSLLPEQLQPELKHLFKLLENERTREKQKVKRWFNSSPYRNTIAAWENFLASLQLEDTACGPKADWPVQKLAKGFILKTWKKVTAMGNSISKESPDEALHNLRLECKKLRYLLEFFASLFPEAEMRYLIKQLKKLQENLGDFNDLCVQQETLHEYLSHQVQADNSSVNIAAAIGGLIANLNRKQQGVRAVFNTMFNQFDQQTNRVLFQNLFRK